MDRYHKKRVKRKQAKERQATRNRRSDEQQLQYLDARSFKAERETKRLKLKIKRKKQDNG